MRRGVLVVLFVTSLAAAHTLKTVNPGGGADYTSLFDANESLPNPLDADYQINCAGATDDTTAAIIGCNTNGHELVIQGDNTTGIFDDAKYQLKVGAAATAITVSASNVVLQNLQVTGISTSYQGIYLNTGYTNVTVKNCLIQDFTRAGAYGGLYVNGGTNRSLYNNVVWNCNSGINTSSATCTLAHNTLTAVTYGIQVAKGGSTVVTAKNNIINGGASGCWTVIGSGSAPVTAYNWTTDATSPDGETYQNQTFTFVGGEDYHLDPGENGVYNCANPSVSGLTADIDGDMRIDWEAGADEIPNPGKPALVHHNRRSY